MQDQILFSVIIPTHNRADLLRIAIQSVVEQTVKKWELLIIDDGSMDNTKEVAKSFDDSRIHYFYQEHKERNTARNLGIQKAKGQYICFLDDDDYFLEFHLQNFFDFLIQNDFPEVILRTGYYKEMPDRRRIKTQNYNPAIHSNPVCFAAFNMCGVWSLCIPKTFLEKDRFALQFPHWQDTHLILRLLARYPFNQLNSYSYVYVIHPQRGSSLLYNQVDATQRIESNVEAMRHLFENYGELILPYLPPDSPAFLYSEKYAQHASNAVVFGKWKLGFHFLQKALAEDPGWKQWKYYIRFFTWSPIYGIYRGLKLKTLNK